MNTNQQNNFMETYNKRHSDSTILKAELLIGIIILRMLFMTTVTSPVNKAKATVKKKLEPSFHLSIELNGEKKTKVIDGRFKDMEFSPSGRYLVVETRKGTDYQMYLFNTYFVVDPLQWYLIEEDLNMMAEWIIRGNDMTIIKPDDKVLLEFDCWDEEKDNIKFEYTILFSDGRESSGNTVIDYTEKTVVYMQSYN